jgi:hypothetical protein
MPWSGRTTTLTKWSDVTSRSPPKRSTSGFEGSYQDKGEFILDVGAGFGRDAALLSAPLSACLAAYFSPDPDLIPSCHSSNRLRGRQ